MDSAFFERAMLTNQNLSPAVRKIHPKAEFIFKDNYVLDFLSLPSKFSEKTYVKPLSKT